MAKIKKIVVEYSFDEQGFPRVMSNLIQNDFDMLDLLLSGDLNTESNLLKFERITMTEHNTWWKNATRVNFESEDLVISAAFDVDASIRISPDILQKVLNDWRIFLTSKITFKSTYED